MAKKRTTKTPAGGIPVKATTDTPTPTLAAASVDAAPELVKVSAVILQHGQPELTRVALASLADQTLPAGETILVDNCSPDGEWEWLSEHGQVVRLETNEGYVRGTNAGWRKAAGECVLLCNNDIALGRHCVERLAAALDADPRLGWVCAVYQAGGWPSAWVRFPREALAELDAYAGARRAALNRWDDTLPARPVVRPAQATEATVFMVRRTASDQVGLYWDRLQLHHSHDYALRLADAGWTLGYVDNAVFWHHVDSPTLARAESAGRDFEREASTRLMDERWGERWKQLKT